MKKGWLYLPPIGFLIWIARGIFKRQAEKKRKHRQRVNQSLSYFNKIIEPSKDIKGEDK